jgi:hypothetical protein
VFLYTTARVGGLFPRGGRPHDYDHKATASGQKGARTRTVSRNAAKSSPSGAPSISPISSRTQRRTRARGSAFVALVHRGKADVAYATPLANYAIRQVIAGRQVGTKPNRRDVLSPNAHADYGIVVERLDMFDEEQGEWRAVLVEDRRATPADIAAARIDVATWLRSLTQRNRRIAKALARGETTSDVAQQFKLSSARISQIRDELKTSWESFQGIRPAIQCFQCPYQATAQ